MSEAKKCKVGFPCGKSCISRLRKCWNNLPIDGESKQFETFSQFVNRIVGVGNEKESMLPNNVTEDASKKKANIDLEEDEAPSNKGKALIFDIEQDLSDAPELSTEDNGSIYDAEDVYILENDGDDLDPNTLEVMKQLNDVDYKYSPEVLDSTNTRIAMSKFDGERAADVDLDDEDKQNIMTAIKELHGSGVAYGNVSDNNIFYDKKSKKPTLTSFDLAETEEIAPYNSNQTPEKLRSTMLQDVFSLQHLFGNKDNQKAKLEKLTALNNGTEIKDFKAAGYKFNENAPGVKSLLKNKKKFDDFIAEFYQA